MDAQQLSDSEIATLRKGATGAGLLVAVSDRSFFDTFKEAGAMAKHLAAAKSGSNSEVVRRVAEGRDLGFGVTTPPDEIRAGTLEALRSAKELLQTKAPEELDAYRSFVLELVHSVASAAGGGDEAEAATIAEVEAALERADRGDRPGPS